MTPPYVHNTVHNRLWYETHGTPGLPWDTCTTGFCTRPMALLACHGHMHNRL
jgi:hypothetical protein